MIKAERAVRHGEEGLEVTIDGKGREIRIELVAILMELMEGGFPEEWMRIAVDVAVGAREHIDEWEPMDVSEEKEAEDKVSIDELMKILNEMKK